MEDLEPVTEFYVCEAMDYELSPGSKIASNSMTIRVLEGGSSTANMRFNHHGLSEAFSIGRSYQYARGTAEHKYFVLCVYVLVLNATSANINFRWLAGTFASHFETFGTYYFTF
ncbi:MAG: hypothetical protein LC132_10585 [Burkholderiales bacterium]|nr:hypothetical protein [Burkholderiales bacterium]